MRGLDLQRQSMKVRREGRFTDVVAVAVRACVIAVCACVVAVGVTVAVAYPS